MSRIGKLPIPIPDGVDVSFEGGELAVKGPKGRLAASLPELISLELEDSTLVLRRPDDKKESRALHGLARALANNMVTGVTSGFTKELEIQGVGYRADVQGRKLNLVLGLSHPVEMEVPEGLDVRMEGPTRLVVEGIDKEQVGQFAANIRSLRPPEPYKGKGIRYADEQVRRKVGKTGAA